MKTYVMDYNSPKQSGRDAFIAGKRRDENPVDSRTGANAKTLWYQGWDEASIQCMGMEIEPGVFSGCDASGGDCPSCDH